MSSAILLMLLTGALWALVGVLFGAAPAEKDRLLGIIDNLTKK